MGNPYDDLVAAGWGRMVSVTLTPAEAGRIARTENATFQAAPDASKVEGLRGAMARGEFQPGTPIIWNIPPGGTRELLDGQHRLLASEAAGVEYEWRVWEHRLGQRERALFCLALTGGLR